MLAGWMDVLFWIRICNNLWSKVILIQLRQHSAQDIPCRKTRGDPICNMILLTWWCFWLAGWMSPSTLLINHWYHIIGFTPPFYAHCIASKPNAVHFLHHLIVIFIIITKCTQRWYMREIVVELSLSGNCTQRYHDNRSRICWALLAHELHMLLW